MPAPVESRPQAPPASLTALIGSPRVEILRLATAPVTCGEIGKRLFMSPGGVTHHLRTLETAGLVRRTRRGRHVNVERTERGRAVMALFAEDWTAGEPGPSGSLPQSGRGLDAVAVGLPTNARLAQALARVDALPDAASQRATRHLTRTGPAAQGGLSAREHAVLCLLASPLTQREIGHQLQVSVNTIKTHARSIFRKLGVSNRREAVERARESGLL